MQNMEMDNGLIKLAEKIVDQNEKIVKMNGMLLETILKPKFSVDCRPDFLDKLKDMDEETRRNYLDGDPEAFNLPDDIEE